jgi:hypothetical protein
LHGVVFDILGARTFEGEFSNVTAGSAQYVPLSRLAGGSDALIFNVADVTTLQFFQLGNDLIVADALDTNFQNYVDVVGFFDPAIADTLEYVFDINGNGIQIS